MKQTMYTKACNTSLMLDGNSTYITLSIDRLRVSWWWRTQTQISVCSLSSLQAAFCTWHQAERSASSRHLPVTVQVHIDQESGDQAPPLYVTLAPPAPTVTPPPTSQVNADW